MLTASYVVLVYGFVLLVLALKFLQEPKAIKEIAKQVEGGHGVAFIAGLLPLIVGTLVFFHFAPIMHTTGMDMLATILGGITLLLGIYRLWFTHAWVKHLTSFAGSNYLHGLLVLYFVVAVVLLLIGGHILPIHTILIG